MSKRNLIGICTILLFHSIFILFKPGEAVSQYAQTIFAILVIFLLRSYVKYLLLPRYRAIIYIILLYSVSISISTYLAEADSVLPNNLLANKFTPIKFSLQLLATLLLVVSINRHRLASVAYRCLLYCSGFYVLVVDAYVLSLPPNTDSAFMYIWGTKFWVAYMNLLFASFYLYIMMLKRKFGKLDNYLFMALLLIIGIISKHADCTTGCIGVVIFMLALLVKRKFLHFFHRPRTFVGSLVLLDIGFFMFFMFMLSVPIIQYIIVNVLNEDLSLNGRVYIYELLPDIMDNRPFFGYGSGNGYKAMSWLLDTQNAQNGLIFNYLDIGVVGSILYLILVYQIVEKSIISFNNLPILIYLVIMIAISIFEISITNEFLCLTLFLLIMPNRGLTVVKHS